MDSILSVDENCFYLMTLNITSISIHFGATSLSLHVTRPFTVTGLT